MLLRRSSIIFGQNQIKDDSNVSSDSQVKVNLGCGTDYRYGYINVDKVKGIKVDVLVDLNWNLPFRDNVFDEVLLIDVIEHLNDPEKVIEEVYRCCKNGAIVYIRSCHFTSASTYADMQHKRGFSIRVFEDYTGKTRWSFQFKPRFKIIKRKIIFPFWNKIIERLVNRSPFTQYVYESTFIRSLFPADGVYFLLEVVK